MGYFSVLLEPIIFIVRGIQLAYDEVYIANEHANSSDFRPIKFASVL